jgi:hypothetical protein
MSEWKKISDVWKNISEFNFYGIWVYNNKTKHRHFEVYYLYVDDEDGQLRTQEGDYFDAWEYNDFTHILDPRPELPAPPEQAEE